jgi:hypothetical protein
LAGTRTRSLSPLLQAVALDNSLPISPIAAALWLRDVENPLRWGVRPLLQFALAALLHVVWLLKRLPLPQFRAHALLQRTICWFCRVFVSPQANRLILRHFATESTILNFLRDNTASDVLPIELYPQAIDDMLKFSFVHHDQELFRMMREMGPWDRAKWRYPARELKWDHWREIDAALGAAPKRWTQVVDFETAHALFMCLFCLLLTAEEYRDSINGFNLDQSIALRIAAVLGDPTIIEMAYNKYPFYLVGPWNLAQRFLMHGFFTEYLHARLEELRCAGALPQPSTDPTVAAARNT